MPLAFAARPAEITCSLPLSIAHFSFLTRFIIIFKACVAQTKSPTSRWSRSSPVLSLENLPALFFIVNDRRMERLDGTRRRPSPRRLQPTHARRLLSRCFLFVHFAAGCPCHAPGAPSAWHGDGDGDRVVTKLQGARELGRGWHGQRFGLGTALMAFLLLGLNKFSALLTFNRSHRSPVDHIY